MSCLRRITKTRSSSSVVVAAALLADYCQVSLHLKEWPAKSMCRELSVNTLTSEVFEYIGQNCSTLCLFGQSSNQSCVCHHGYWGLNCMNVCPGGAKSPCYDHGYCSPESGKCECDTNWQGNENCSACSQGFYGPDCLIGLQNFESSKISYVSKVFTKNILQTFDNIFMTVKKSGEYTGFESRISDLLINLRFVQRFRSVALIGVAIRLKQNIVVIYAGASKGLTITVNRKVINIQDRIALGHGYEYSRLSQHHFAIKASNGFAISIYNESLSLSVEMMASSSICVESTGLFGACKNSSPCAITSKTCNTSNISSYNTSDWTSATLESIFRQWEVPANSSMFTHILGIVKAPLHQTSAQTCLQFDRAGLVTGPLHGILVSKYVSIQLMVKVASSINAGTIISFAHNTTLSIILDGTVKIHRESIDIDTGLIVPNDIWTQLTIVYQKVTGVLQVFRKYDSGLSQSVVYFVGFGWFEDGLSLGIGISQVSKVAAVSLSYPMFSGSVDDVRIWSTRLDGVTIDAHWKSDVDIYDQSLKALWKMDEGAGMTVHDSVGTNHISMPPTGWVLPSWENAAYELYDAKQMPRRRRQILKIAAEATCRDFLYDNTLQDTCRSVLGNSTSIYYHGCVESILAENSTRAADEAMLSFSSTCMRLLNLTTNPARHLCNRTAGKHIDGYYGVNCSQKCEYGELADGSCICFKGYWGANCSSECPGGASMPCHGHGVCLQGNGKCICDYNWRGDTSCSSCTLGWQSPHCLKVESPNLFASHQVCSVTRLGVYHGFNGIEQRLVEHGSYNLVNSSKVQVYAVTVDCFKDAVCTTEINITTSFHQISLLKNYGSISSDVIVDRNPIKVDGFVQVSSDISIALLSFDKYLITIGKYLQIEISSDGFYYSLSLYSQKPTCDDFSGLCGSCIPGTSSTSVPVGSPPKSLYFGQFSLYFSKATMYTSEVNIFSTTQATIEFIVKSCNPKDCGGPIVAFASVRTVYITNYLTVKMLIGDTVYDSGIQTTIDEWNHVIVTCNTLQRKIDIYVAHGKKYLHHRSFLMDTYPFAGSGIISVGSWTPSMTGLDKQPFRTFTGEIDEMRVWDRYFDYAMVRQRVFSNVNRPIQGLKAAWKMDERDGYVVKDLVGDSDMIMPEYPLGSPARRVSSAPLGSPVKKISFDDDTPVRLVAETFCQDTLIKGHVGNACMGIAEAVKQFFVSNCILEIVQTQLKSASLRVIVEYSDMCQRSLSLSDWPARPLCNLFKGLKFPNWIGTNCSVNCVFGSRSYDNADKCVCDNGYWGTSCNETCDGGFIRPCSNHGICNQDSGRCTCDPMWTGDKNCSACSSGFTGEDCSVSKTTAAMLQSSHAFVSLRGYLTLFGGYGIVLKRTGEYRLIYSSSHNISVYGRFVVCFGKESCLNSLVFRFSKTQVVLHAPYKTEENIKIWLNKKLMDIYKNRDEILAGHIKIVRKTPSLYAIIHVLGEYKVSVIGTYLTFDISVSGDICTSSYGLLGNCHQNLSDLINTASSPLHCSRDTFTKFVTKKSVQSLTVNQTNIQLFTNQQMIQLCESSFIYKYDQVTEHRDANSGYAMKFNHSSLVLLNSTVLNSHLCTFDFMIYLEQDGTILSYGSDTTFLLVTINFEFQIWIGKQIYKTGLYSEHKAWNQIILQWKKSRNQFTVFVFDQLGVLHWRKIDVAGNIDIFQRGGVLGIGQWQPAFNESYTKPNSTFVGFVEQLRIWEKEFSPAVIWQLWSRDVHSDSRYLTAKIDFDNTEDSYLTDEISNRVVNLASEPWRKPSKLFSGVLQKSQLGVNVKRTGNTELIGRASVFCKQFIVQGPLYGHCNALGNGIAMFYYRLCVEMSSGSVEMYIGLHAVVSYSDYCQASLNLTFWPARDLCGSVNMTRSPKRMQEHCAESCFYGHLDTNGSCRCIKGYWGERCNRVCPGGAYSPCNDQGVCDVVSGKCKCNVNWNGDESCSNCSLGWIGRDCQIAQIDRTVSLRVNGFQAFLIDGNVMLFSGHVLAFKYVGQYWLYRDIYLDSDVRIWQAPCYVHKLCISALRMRFTNVAIVITAPKPGHWKERVLVDNEIVKLTSAHLTKQAGSHSISLRYAARNQIVITIGKVNFASVTIFERSLSILVDRKTDSCSSNSGILGACINDTDSVTAGLLAERLHHEWEVRTSEAIVGITEEIKSFSSAEYAVLFEDTGAVSNPLCHSFEGNGDYTIEFLIKPMNSQFFVMSYSLASTFAMYANETYRIIATGVELDSGIKARNGIWQQLTIMYWSDFRRLDFYVFEKDRLVQRRAFLLSHYPFFRCGIMALGQWLPSTNMPEGPRIVNSGFYIDEIRIWSRAFDPLTVQQNYRMNVLKSHPELKGLWKVNEFDGDILYNLKSERESLHLPSAPWQRPLRVLSTAGIGSNISDIFGIDVADNMTSIEEHCKALFFKSELWTKCHSLQSAMSYFYLVCIKDVALTNTSYAVYSVINFADTCQSLLNLTTWPATSLCHALMSAPGLLSIGNYCKTVCVFGKPVPDNSSQCICDKGYWGRDCSYQCPGGAILPCSGHGRCIQSTGVCLCDQNWSGNANCSACGTNWLGTSCNVTIEPFNLFKEKASAISFVTANGQVTTFNGFTINIRTTKEIILVHNPLKQFLISVKSSPCSAVGIYNSLCLTFLTIRHHGLSIVLRAPYFVQRAVPQIVTPVLVVNGRLLKVDHVTYISAETSLSRISRNVYTLISSGVYELRITIRQKFDISMKLSREYCTAAKGILGNCDLVRETLVALNERLAVGNLVPLSDSAIDYRMLSFEEKSFVFGSLYGVHMKDTGMVSTLFTTLDYPIVSLEMYVYPLSHGGTLIAYMGRNIFALSNEATMRLFIGSDVINTGLSTETGE